MWLRRPDTICVNSNDQVSYNGGPFHGEVDFINSDNPGGVGWILKFTSYGAYAQTQTYIFKPIVGTDAWLHVRHDNEMYNCILIPHMCQNDSMN